MRLTAEGASATSAAQVNFVMYRGGGGRITAKRLGSAPGIEARNGRGKRLCRKQALWRPPWVHLTHSQGLSCVRPVCDNVRNHFGENTMIFRQLFDSVSGTYSYLLASRQGGEALILDPVLEKADRYCQLLRELDLKLVKAIDTHLHADHITGLGVLRDRTHCITIMGEQSKADVVSMRVCDGDKVTIEGLCLDVMYTPGHTDDSYSYLMGDRVFTGDTLLIRGTGRTDFQNGNARAQYDSIFNRLLKLPEETLVYPAHDYKGDTVSTIGEEKRYNPRLKVGSVDEYVELMGNLNLPNPKLMDVVVPANMHVGLHQEDLDKQGLALSAREAILSLGRPDILLVDLRETGERSKHGVLAGALHAPYPSIGESLKPGGMLREVAAASGRRIVFFCAFGERSAMAVAAANEAGLVNAAHITGGIDAWKKAGGPVVQS
jgi:glyoxylase-like metal-dependent hydrolase (beta-lactamase superfamily II)/rhodanese-related sulfurtransferase